MTEAELDAMCAAANKRLHKYINQCAAQQMRRMREMWSKS